MHTARITLLLASTWTVSSSAFLSPTLHMPWVLYGVRQRCNEGGYRLEQHSHLETNWQASVKLIKYPITPIPQSLFDEFQTRKTATLYRCRARNSLLWQHCGSWGQKIAHYLQMSGDGLSSIPTGRIWCHVLQREKRPRNCSETTAMKQILANKLKVDWLPDDKLVKLGQKLERKGFEARYGAGRWVGTFK